MVKFGIEFVPMDLYWRTTFYTIQAEKAGFDYVWITDHFNNRNVYVTLTCIALHTNKIKMGPGVTNPYLVNPVMTAQSVASISEIAPNRVTLGIGAGDKTTLSLLGVEIKSPLTAIRESVEIIRSLITTGKAKYSGKIFSVQKAKFNFKPKGKIPIYIGAQGPKMLELAAKIGDGILINASHPKDIGDAFQYIKSGAEKANRKLEEIDVAAYTSFSVHEKEKKAIKAATPVVAFIVSGSPEPVLEKHEISIEDAMAIKKALEAGNWGEAFSKVTPEMIDAFSISGTPETCIERINELIKLGVSQFVVGSPIGPNVREAIDLISKEIIPHFKE